MADLERLLVLISVVFFVGVCAFIFLFIIYNGKEAFSPLWSLIRFRKTERVFDSFIILITLLLCAVPCFVFGMRSIMFYISLFKVS